MLGNQRLQNGTTSSSDASIRPTDSPPGGWPDPRAAYIHVPFCRHRCGYCNFSVLTGRNHLAAPFLRAIDQELAELHRPRIDTVFVGGGTPTQLAPPQLRQLLSSIGDRFEWDDSVEWSVEANPEDLSDEKLSILREAGVNRISLGVQSFNTDKLRTLERGHEGEEAVDVIERAAKVIPNLSIDLIFACPGESLAVWKADLTTALGLPIQHLSTYALTFEKGTSFWSSRRRGELQPATESMELAMYQLARRHTLDAGLTHYEISNFARPGARCRHNLAYWDGRGWFAAGPGAARFVEGRREVNHRSPTTYLKRMQHGVSPIAESESISPEQYARERAAFGIRLLGGVDLNLLSRETGIDLPALFGDAIADAVANGLVSETRGHLRLTERGLLFADSVASKLLG